MNDIIIQFAILWGMKSAIVLPREEKWQFLKDYDSEEVLTIVTKWAEEFMKENYDDTVEFAENKFNELLKQNV